MSRSPKTEPATLASQPQDTRSVPQRIIDAALEQAQTMGVQGMTQAAVAAAAGVRQSHLTYYFPTRADLVKATVYAIRDQVMESLHTALPLFGDKAQALQALRAFCLQEVCDLGKARLLLALMVAGEEEASLKAWNDEFHHENLGRWIGIYHELGIKVSEEEVELFHVAFIGATLLAGQSGSASALMRAQRVAAMAFDRLLQSASTDVTA